MNSITNNDLSSQEFIESLELKENMSRIKNKYIVLSGKGGVGKSSIAVNIAVGLALEGYNVGLMDIDIHGPSIPKMLGLEKATPELINGKIQPVRYSDNLHVMSISFMMSDPEEAIIWRGPLKMSVIKQFLGQVNWGELDYLIVDSPPGTGDEPLSVCQLIENPDGAIIVTTPQEIALNDVRKSIKFCAKLRCPVLGVIENMSGFSCPHCNKTINIFKTGGGKIMAEQMNVNFLGSIPIDPEVVIHADISKPYIHYCPNSNSTHNLKEIISSIIKVSK